MFPRAVFNGNHERGLFYRYMNGIKLCRQFDRASLVYSTRGHVCCSRAVSLRLRNVGEQHNPPPPLPDLHCERAWAWHEELQGSHVTQRTLTSVIRPAAIQFRADQCLQHKQRPGQSERERITQKQWWAILQTAITDNP